MSSKSEGRKLLQARCPDGFLAQDPKGVPFALVIDDNLLAIRSINPGNPDPKNKIRTGRDLVNHIKRNIEYHLQKTACEVYIVSWDKPDYVDIAKGVEQAKRHRAQRKGDRMKKTVALVTTFLNDISAIPAETRKKAIAAIKQPVAAYLTECEETDQDYADGEITQRALRAFADFMNDSHTLPGDDIGALYTQLAQLFAEDTRRGMDIDTTIDFEVHLDLPIPDAWSAAVHDRDGGRRTIIKFLARHLLDPASEMRVDIPPKKILIIDGHGHNAQDVDVCMQWVDAQSRARVKEMRDAAGAPLDIAAVPLLGTRATSGIRSVVFAPEYYNLLGECDFVSWFYVDKFPQYNVKFATTDTDALYMGLIYLRRCSRNGTGAPPERQIFLYTAPPGGYKPETAACHWVDLNYIYQWFYAQRDIVKHYKEPIYAFVVAMVSAGSDFTDGCYFVPHKHFAEAFWAYPEMLGGLVQVDETAHEHHVLLDGAHHVRLHRLAYITAYARYFDDKPLREWVYPKFVARLTERLSDGKAKPEEKARKMFPSHTAMVCKYLRTYYYLVMMNQVGLPRPIHRLDVASYGYAARKDAEPLSRNNIDRAENVVAVVQ